MPALTRISTKGQVVIPQALREALKLQPGDTLQVEQHGDIILLKKVPLVPLRKNLRRA